MEGLAAGVQAQLNHRDKPVFRKQAAVIGSIRKGLPVVGLAGQQTLVPGAGKTADFQLLTGIQYGGGGQGRAHFHHALQLLQGLSQQRHRLRAAGAEKILFQVEDDQQFFVRIEFLGQVVQCLLARIFQRQPAVVVVAQLGCGSRQQPEQQHPASQCRPGQPGQPVRPARNAESLPGEKLEPVRSPDHSGRCRHQSG